MPTIKFSLLFPKLYGNTNHPIPYAKLIQVVEMDLSDMTEEMRRYDTANNSYPLPLKGAYLMLIFLKPGNIHLFTTFRRSTPEKLRYYKEMIGQLVTISIAENETAV